MKFKYGIVNVLLVAQAICHAEVTGPLSTLRNKWGKGSIVDFRKVAYENLPLLFDEGGTVAVEGWCNELIDYPDFWKETETIYWMEEKASTLSLCISMQFLRASTNCWLAAAGLLGRYRAIARAAESNANVKVDVSLIKTNPKRYNELLYGRKPLKIKAWNLKHAETSLARVVTNEFPKSVLPLLPESERDKMMSEVLERSGIVEVEKDSAREASGRIPRGPILIGAVASFVLIGSLAVLRRLKSP